MGYFSWKTADTQESIPNCDSSRLCRTVYLLQPSGKPSIEEPSYEGYGEFGGVDAYVWLAENNLPVQALAAMTSDDELRDAGIALESSGIVFRYKPTGKLYTIFHDAAFLPAIGVERKCLGVHWDTPIEDFGGLSPNEAREQGLLESVKIDTLLEIKHPLKFSFDKNARYEDLPASEICEAQGYFYD